MPVGVPLQLYAVYSPLVGWLQDTCAGGVFSWDASLAVWFDSPDEAREAMKAAEIEIVEHLFIRVR